MRIPITRIAYVGSGYYGEYRLNHIRTSKFSQSSRGQVTSTAMWPWQCIWYRLSVEFNLLTILLGVLLKNWSSGSEPSVDSASWMEVIGLVAFFLMSEFKYLSHKKASPKIIPLLATTRKSRLWSVLWIMCLLSILDIYMCVSDQAQENYTQYPYRYLSQWCLAFVPSWWVFHWPGPTR